MTVPLSLRSPGGLPTARRSCCPLRNGASAAPRARAWQRWPPAGRQRLAVQARQRRTGRSTSSQQPPVDPDRRTQRRRGPGKESFDAELLVLFGLPALVLIIAFAFNEPGSLAVAIPLALLVPGPRDVLLSVAGDMIRAASRAARFVSVDSGVEDAAASNREAEAQQQARRGVRWQQPPAQQQQQQQQSWGRRPPPPPPPPPQAAGAAEYELRGGEYVVYSPPQQPPSAYTSQKQYAQQPPPPYQHPSYHQVTHQQPQQYQQPQQPPPQQPPPQQPPFQQQLQQGTYQPLYQQPFGQQQPFPQREDVPLPPSFAEAWPPVSAGQDEPAAGSSSWDQEPSSTSWGAPVGLGSSRRLRRNRGPGPTAATASAPSSVALVPRRRKRQASRLAHGARQGRVAAEAGRERNRTPLLLRPLFALIPFLRFWGGFL